MKKALLLAALVPLASAAHGFVLSGEVQEANGAPVPGAEVTVFRDGAASVPLKVAHCDNMGRFETLVEGVSGNLDFFVVAEWRAFLTPPARFGFHSVELEGLEISQGTGGTILFAEQKGVVIQDHDTDMDLTYPTIQMRDGLPAGVDLGMIRSALSDALTFYIDNKGSAPWELTYDVMVNLRLWTAGSAHSTGILKLSASDVTGTNFGGAGQGYVSDVYHEVGHLVHYFFNAASLPSASVSLRHHARSESSDPVAALKEGWPSYVAARTDQLFARDGNYRVFEDTRGTNWRGDEMPTPTGFDSGAFESGEKVEGALSGIWLEIDGGVSFEANFATMIAGSTRNVGPKNIVEFFDEFIRQQAASSFALSVAFDASYNHGVPFSRARFGSTGFTEDKPPDQAPPEDGNVVKIDNVWYLRGEVEVPFDEVSASDLGVSQKQNLIEVALTTKSASSGIGDTVQDFLMNFLAPTPFSSGMIRFDTEDFDSKDGDGEWDLALVGRNSHDALDNLKPSWDGDGTLRFDSDEKYLKTLGTWFDDDQDPVTQDGGKVVVDNTAPKLTEFKPENPSP